MSKCRDCWTPLKFVHITNTGRPMPIDPAPDPGGNVIARPVGGQLTGHVLRKGEGVPEGWQRYMPHHATCQARSHSKRGAAKPLTLFDANPLFDTPEGTTT